MIRASKLLGAKVVDNENKKVGLLVNVIFNTNPDYLYANLLIFPDKTKRWLNKLSEFLEGTTLDYIKENFPADYPKMAKDIAEKGSEQAFKMWKQYLEEKEEESMKTYYLVPLHEIENPGQDYKELKIKNSLKECLQYQGCEPDKNEDFPFFRNRSFTGLETLLTTTLTLEPVEGLKANLPDEKKGRTVDLELDPDGGSVGNLIVRTYGKGAGEHLVDAKDFDFSELKAKKTVSAPDTSDN